MTEEKKGGCNQFNQLVVLPVKEQMQENNKAENPKHTLTGEDVHTHTHTVKRHQDRNGAWMNIKY